MQGAALIGIMPGECSARRVEAKMKKLLIIAMAAGTFVLGACNTVEGAGRDVQSVGRTIEDVGD